jgi:uncharacterized protein YcbX
VRTGSVEQLWRYPVKSMMGERLSATDVTPLGVLGDRGWATRDERRGGIRGAKKIGPLMQLAARYEEEPTAAAPTPHVRITLPDGSEVSTAASDVDQRVSHALDHPVTLWPLQPPSDVDHYRRGAPDSDDITIELRDMFQREEDEPLPDFTIFPPEMVEFESRPGTYYDVFPLLLLSTASLRSLQELAPASVVDVRRFRPNVLVDIDGGGFPEQDWIGRRVCIGDVEVDVVAGCPRCVMITRPFADLPADRALMRTVVRELDQNLGVYATVATPGRVAVGDAVEVASPEPPQPSATNS